MVRGSYRNFVAVPEIERAPYHEHSLFLCDRASYYEDSLSFVEVRWVFVLYDVLGFIYDAGISKAPSCNMGP